MSMDNFSGWLIRMLCEVRPSVLEDEIPERDLEKIESEAAYGSAAMFEAEAVRKPTAAEDHETVRAGNPRLSAEMRDSESGRRARSNWKAVVVISGFAAACSAAVTGIIVFVCMRHSASCNA